MTPIPKAIVNTAANLRAGPGTNYAIIGAAQQGEAVQIAGRSGDWLQLDSGAWIAASLIDDFPTTLPTVVILPASPIPTATARVLPTSTPVPPPAYNGPAFCAGHSGARYGAICSDGTTSTATGSGACSHHGGVRTWLVCP